MLPGSPGFHIFGFHVSIACCCCLCFVWWRWWSCVVAWVVQASDPAIQKIVDIKYFPDGTQGPVLRSADLNSLCARDHKWELMQNAINREVCDCAAQFRQVHEVYRLWNCTHQLPINPYPPVTYVGYTPQPQRTCTFPANSAYALSSPWHREVVWDSSLNSGAGDYRVLSEPIKFPRPGDEEFYFRNCSSVPDRDCSVNVTGWPHDDYPCLQFCSWSEMSAYITKKVRRVPLWAVVFIIYGSSHTCHCLLSRRWVLWSVVDSSILLSSTGT